MKNYNFMHVKAVEDEKKAATLRRNQKNEFVPDKTITVTIRLPLAQENKPPL